MMQDLKSQINPAVSLVPAVRTAGAANGTAVALADYNRAVATFSFGDLGGGAATPKVQESNDGSTNWVDIDASRLNGTLAAATANSVQSVGITDIGGLTKAFVRAVITVTGGTGAGCAATIVRGNPVKGPAGVGGSAYIA